MAWEAMLRLTDGDVGALGWERLRKEDIRCMEDAEELARSAEQRQTREDQRIQREDELRRQGELPLLTTAEQEERAKRSGENMRKVSWIWTGRAQRARMLIWKRVSFFCFVFRDETGTDENGSALRIEWCKAWARTNRWHEELCLVEEEVCRAGVSLEYCAQEWEERVRSIPVTPEERSEWGALSGAGEWTVERAEGAIAYGLKQADMYRDIARRVKVSMTEERRGRGKRRRLVHGDEWVDVVGATGTSEDDNLALEDLRGDEVADDDFLGGGGEED
jgi:hypothetical protein